MANDFSVDSSWVGVYRFESGAMTTDSSGSGNTLTDVNTVVENTTDVDEGACSADFEGSIGERFLVLNGNLSINFPGKTGYTDLAISGRFRFESLPGSGLSETICSKWRGDGYRSWALVVSNIDGVYIVRLLIGYAGGASHEIIDLYTGALSSSTWYYIGVSFDDSEKAYLYTLWRRGTPDVQLGEGSGTTTNNMSPNTGHFSIGSLYSNYGSAASYWDGELDEIAIANSPKTLADFDAIRLGTYGGGSTLSPISGSFGAVAKIQGSASKKILLSGMMDCLAGPSGAIGVKKHLAGSMAAMAGASGTVCVKKSLFGVMTCDASVSVSATVIRRMAGRFESVAGIEGLVIISEPNRIHLSGSMAAMAAMESALNVKRGLTGVIAAGPDINGSVSIRLNLSGSVEAVGAMIGELQFIGQGTLGVVVDPSIDSVTVRRLLESITVKRSIHIITAEHAIESI
jgi:hypothetical protein